MALWLTPVLAIDVYETEEVNLPDISHNSVRQLGSRKERYSHLRREISQPSRVKLVKVAVILCPLLCANIPLLNGSRLQRKVT